MNGATDLLICLFSGWRTEQDKTQRTVTLVETARALFTGGSFSVQLCQKICIIIPYCWFILVGKRCLQMFDAILLFCMENLMCMDGMTVKHTAICNY